MVERTVIIENSRGPSELLLRQYESLTALQVNADTVYHNRTSIITLTQGLVFVGFQTLVSSTAPRVVLVSIALVGAILALLWLLFEQRNLAFFKARASVLRDLENRLVSRYATNSEGPFHAFWSEVPALVKRDATWIQSFSAQGILRFCIPVLFLGLWIGLTLAVLLGLLEVASQP